MRIFNLWQSVWGKIWWLSEFTGVGLGRFAPWVFHQTIGCDRKVKRIE